MSEEAAKRDVFPWVRADGLPDVWIGEVSGLADSEADVLAWAAAVDDVELTVSTCWPIDHPTVGGIAQLRVKGVTSSGTRVEIQWSTYGRFRHRYDDLVGEPYEQVPVTAEQLAALDPIEVRPS